MSNRAIKIIQEWRKLHKTELLEDWELAEQKKLCLQLNHWNKDMILHVKEAKYLHDYVIWVKFNDGMAGKIDLQNELEGEMLGPLKNEKFFKSFKVDPVLETIVWRNGADLAPEFLHDNIKIPNITNQSSRPIPKGSAAELKC